MPGNLKLPYVTALGIVKDVAGMSLGERDVEILNKDRVVDESVKTQEGLFDKFIKFFKQ